MGGEPEKRAFAEARGPEKPKPPSFPARPTLAVVALVAFAVLLGVIVSDQSGRVTFANLPSYWGSLEMTCATVRVEEDDRTLEFFRCKAQGAGQLPPGAYRPPETNWNSDFDRRRATDHAIGSRRMALSSAGPSTSREGGRRTCAGYQFG